MLKQAYPEKWHSRVDMKKLNECGLKSFWSKKLTIF